MSKARGIVTPAKDPLQVVESERLEALVVNIEKVEGKFGEQLQFTLKLPDEEYNVKTWMKYYEKPSENTDLGKLLLAIMTRLNKDIDDVEEGLDWLTHYGRVFIECTGFRAYNGKNYPKFKVVPGILPPTQPQQGTFP